MNTKDDELRREQRADGKDMAKSRYYVPDPYRLYIITGKHSAGRRGRGRGRRRKRRGRGRRRGRRKGRRRRTGKKKETRRRRGNRIEGERRRRKRKRQVLVSPPRGLLTPRTT